MTSSANRVPCREIAHLQLPQQVIVQAARLGQVLLDGGQIFEPSPRRGERRLQRAVFQELFPVDLLHLLFLRALRHVDVALEPLRLTYPFFDGTFAVERAGTRPIGVVAGARIDFVIGKNGVRVELFANFVDESRRGAAGAEWPAAAVAS